jgi:hypothetical protein
MHRWEPYAGLFLLIFAYIYKDLLVHMSTSLMDRLDYPYIVWVINNNIHNILAGNFTNYFSTRGFYPHPHALLFSDILLPQSLLVLPFYVVTRNIVLAFNIVYVLTYLLNYTAAFLFWKHFFKKNFLAFLGALLIVFGPFYHMQMGHFQMQSYWIGLFGLLLILKCIDSRKVSFWKAGIAGLLIGIQFLASVYICIFFLAFSAIIWGVSILYSQDRRLLLQRALVMYGITALTMAPFIKAYYTMKQYYGMHRDIAEIILYAAHMTDYLFTRVYTSAFYNLPFWNYWNQFDKHVIGEKAVFPGIFLLGCAAIGLFSFARRTKGGTGPVLQIPLDRLSLIFMVTALAGFIGSLGPRLSFNGTYAHIPTPYLLGLKVLPMLDGIRSPTRWGFLLIIALIFFSLRGLDKLGIVKFFSANRNRTAIIGALLVVWILFEYLPRPAHTYTIAPTTEQHAILQKECAEDPTIVVLEYPVTHFTVFGGIVEGLGYISNIQLAQVSHNCLLMNGYSGFIPQQVFDTEAQMNDFVGRGDVEGLHAFVQESGIDILIFNQDFVLDEYRQGHLMLVKALSQDPRFTELTPGEFKIKN